MKYFITFLVLALFSFFVPREAKQKTYTPMEFDDYEKFWNDIAALESEGLTKSAYDQVELLYLKALKDENQEQRIKTLIYVAKYLQMLEEESELKSFIRFEEELDRLEFPAKQILASYLAGLYEHYYSSRSHIIDDRTALSEAYSIGEMEDWPRDAFINKMDALHQLASSHDGLQNVSLKEYNALIVNLEEEGASVRDNMYDLLAHRAIDYYKNSMFLSNDLPEMDWDNPLFYAPAETFANSDFNTLNDGLPANKVIELFQELTKFHLATSEEKLLDIDLKRISYIHQRSNADTKESWYLEYLNNLMNKFNDSEQLVRVSKELAGYYIRKAPSYSEKEPEAKEYYIIARKLLEKALQQYPTSTFSLDCQSLLNQIHQKEIRIEVEQVSSINKAQLGYLQFRNLDQVFLRVYEVDPKKIFDRHRRDYDAMIKYVKASNLVKSWDFNVPETGDHHRHSLEFGIDALQGGCYALLASANKDFSNNNNALGFATFHVSNLGYVKYDDKEQSSLLVYNRNSGMPVPNATVNIFVPTYENNRGEERLDQEFSLLTNKDGKVDFKVKTRRNTYRVDISTAKDQLNLNEYHRSSYINHGQQRLRVHLMTDRSIYRPGQISHLKGIVTKYDHRGVPSINAYASGTVELRNTNGKVVNKVDVKANEYGSFNTNFILPSDGLAGRMTIISNFNNVRSQKNIQVEEYKRPKFKVDIDTLKKAFVLNDQVEITGKAMSYNGFGIDAGKISYTVTRSIYSPWRYSWRYRPTSGVKKIVASGVGETNADGSFKIEFLAKGEIKKQSKYVPGYQFMIHVDITDLSGETRSGSYPLRISETPFFIHSDLPKSIDAKKWKGINVKAENLNGGNVPIEGIISIEKLVEEKNDLKSRRWSAPDVFLYKKELFKEKFADRVYKDEENPELWDIKESVKSIKFDTKTSKHAPLGKLLDHGTYKIVIEATDELGNKQSEVQYISVHQSSKCDFAYGTQVEIQKDKEHYQPGETVTIDIATSHKPLKLYYVLEKNRQIDAQKWIKVNDKESIEIPVTEKDRGGFAVHLFYGYDGEITTKKLSIDVPWTNKQLDLEFEVFRDELLPGQEEEWKIKIKNSSAEKVKAEMLASMYDASLDAFVAHDWVDRFYPTYSSFIWFDYKGYGLSHVQFRQKEWNPKYINMSSTLIYPALDNFGLYFNNYYNNSGVIWAEAQAMEDDGVLMERSAPSTKETRNVDGIRAKTAGVSSDSDEESSAQTNTNEDKSYDVPVRTNLDETVFFYPDLKTNADGDIIFSFKMNEALTKWKFMTFAHTEDFELAYRTKEVVTSKDLMVFPNLPRFFRQGDQIFISGKIQNKLDTQVHADVALSFIDPISLEALDTYNSGLDMKQVTLPPKGSASVQWSISISDQQLLPLAVRMVAKSGSFSDGEQQVIPVVSNRMMVTESYALPLKSEETRTFHLEAFDKAKASESAVFHKYALEFTSNPAWYAVQALPYLMEYPYQCTEQIFNRYYANTLATHVANSSPKIKAVFDQWKNTDALMSALSKNEDLKSAILEETPWVRDAQSEEEQKKRIGLLFDLNKMSNEQASAIRKISLRQLSDGGFPWFEGPRSNRYITQYILEGIGHLEKLGVSKSTLDKKLIQKALAYSDAELLKQYNYLLEHKMDISKDHLNSIAIHYLYVRSFFDAQIPNQAKVAFDYYMGQANEYWLNKGLYEQGMIALAKSRYNELSVTEKIVRSLKERAIIHDELGMYWKSANGYYWYEAPIERHALMVELFEDQNDALAVNQLKTWLLKNKQTNAWKTTKATASAVYALLIGGENWLLSSDLATIKLSEMQVEFDQGIAEAGTGYVQKSWTGSEIKEEFNEVTVANPNKHIAWGGVYYQYFEDLNKIGTFEETPLTLKKGVFKKVVDGSQHVLIPMEETDLHVGDELIVRITLKVDRDMEFIHLKDMRASGLEPMNVLSGYKWSHGLGYYQSTKDLATHFFMDRLPKGSYVFEYPLRVFHAGSFSNGISTIQSMYAPEFSSHSEGLNIEIKE